MFNRLFPRYSMCCTAWRTMGRLYGHLSTPLQRFNAAQQPQDPVLKSLCWGWPAGKLICTGTNASIINRKARRQHHAPLVNIFGAGSSRCFVLDACMNQLPVALVGEVYRACSVWICLRRLQSYRSRVAHLRRLCSLGYAAGSGLLCSRHAWG